MNENKSIDNPRIKMRKCVSVRLKIKKTRWIISKTTVSVIFNIQKLSVIDFVLTDRRNLPGKRPKSACGKSSTCRFLFSAARISITKAAEYVTLGFFRILVFFPFYESFDVTVFKRWLFFSVLVAIIRQNYDKRPWIENGEGFAVHSSTWRSCAKGEWRSAADWRYHTGVKKYRIFP